MEKKNFEKTTIEKRNSVCAKQTTKMIMNQNKCNNSSKILYYINLCTSACVAFLRFQDFLV